MDGPLRPRGRRGCRGLAKHAGVPVDTVRFYERVGVLAAPARRE
jgi:hypothetical protein